MPVGALLGTVNTILALVDRYAPRAVVCASGAEDAVYRRELYPPYHAHRDPMPAELRAQWEPGRGTARAFGWTVAATPSSRPTTCSGRARASRPQPAGGR
jgi:DNA polymerase-1